MSESILSRFRARYGLPFILLTFFGVVALLVLDFAGSNVILQDTGRAFSIVYFFVMLWFFFVKKDDSVEATSNPLDNQKPSEN
ncbi:MAG: hypothetical protein PXY39_11510 [archaeon]|nr:hypothetical protein [archaeon]